MLALVQWEQNFDEAEGVGSIISSISLFSHFYIISMKHVHLVALLRD